VKSSSRWLIIFGAAIGALVIVAIALVFTMAKPGGESLLPADTPEGTVQRYLLALEAEDYKTAYSYLSFPPNKQISYDVWKGRAIRYEEKHAVKVTLEKSMVTGDEATVSVMVDVFRANEPFENPPFENPVYTSHVTFSLKKEGASWKINSPTYMGWFFY
jgi:hypothetical protein